MFAQARIGLQREEGRPDGSALGGRKGEEGAAVYVVSGDERDADAGDARPRDAGGGRDRSPA